MNSLFTNEKKKMNGGFGFLKILTEPATMCTSKQIVQQDARRKYCYVLNPKGKHLILNAEHVLSIFILCQCAYTYAQECK